MITVYELETLLQAGAPVVLLDVREPDEFELGHIPGAVSMPLLEVPDRLDELDPGAEIVVCCHTGSRSEDVVTFLERQGFTHVNNFDGGVDVWALAIDPSFPVYERNAEKSGALKRAFWDKVARGGYQ